MMGKRKNSSQIRKKRKKSKSLSGFSSPRTINTFYQGTGSIRPKGVPGDGWRDQAATVTGLKRKPKGNKEFFPRSNANEKVFLFPESLEKQLKAEWAKPIASRQLLGFKNKTKVCILWQRVLSSAPGWCPSQRLTVFGTLVRSWGEPPKRQPGQKG